MPNYRISDETHRRLQRWAVPLADSRDGVIRRVLDVAEEKADQELQQLRFYSRSKLQEAIEGFLTTREAVRLLPPTIREWGFVEHLADYILDEGGGDDANDSPDAG